jgi:hypothetical protein
MALAFAFVVLCAGIPAVAEEEEGAPGTGAEPAPQGPSSPPDEEPGATTPGDAAPSPEPDTSQSPGTTDPGAGNPDAGDPDGGDPGEGETPSAPAENAIDAPVETPVDASVETTNAPSAVAPPAAESLAGEPPAAEPPAPSGSSSPLSAEEVEGEGNDDDDALSRGWEPEKRLTEPSEPVAAPEPKDTFSVPPVLFLVVGGAAAAGGLVVAVFGAGFDLASPTSVDDQLTLADGVGPALVVTGGVVAVLGGLVAAGAVLGGLDE